MNTLNTTRTWFLGAILAAFLAPSSLLAQAVAPGIPARETPDSDIPNLITALRSDDVSERFSALAALAQRGPEAAPAIPTLVSLLNDDTSQKVRDQTVIGYHVVSVRYEASRVLLGLGPTAVPHLVSILKAGPNHRARTLAAWTLEEMFRGTHGGRTVARKNTSELERARFRTWLEAIRDPELRAAVHSLEESEEGKAMGSLVACLDGYYEPIAPYYSEWQAKTADATMDTAPLIAALQDRNAPAREFAAKLLGQLKLSEAIQPLIEALGGNHSSGIERALGRIGAPAVGPLIETIGDRESPNRERAGWALFNVRDPEAADQLIAGLEHRDALVRKWCATSLTRLGMSRAVEPLIEALGDDDREVRSAAAATLGQIGVGGDKAVPPLIRLLQQDPRYEVRVQAAGALGRIVPGTKPATAALKKAIKTDDHKAVRKVASDALEKLHKTKKQAE